MKIFSGLKNPDATSLENARGCLASNLAVPGLGSLVGGRKVGLLQLPLYLASFGITLGFGTQFVFWTLSHWAELHSPAADPFEAMREIFRHARWPFLGFALFVISWLWALLTSWSLLAEAKRKTPPPA